MYVLLRCEDTRVEEVWGPFKTEHAAWKFANTLEPGCFAIRPLKSPVSIYPHKESPP